MGTEKLKFKIELFATMWDKPPHAEILINDKNITPRGSFIEAGYALGKGKRVICIGDLPKSAMVSRFIHFKDINDFIFTLNNED